MPPTEYDSGSVAWVLISSALVFLMTPGLAFFYGGMVRAKHVLAMLMQNFTAIAVAGIAWVLVGFSIAFGDGGPLIGDLSYLGLTDYSTPIDWTGLPLLVFVCFQSTFAIISLALVTGATADRWKFGSYVVFGALWVVLIYSVIAHWVWGGGWIGELGALDFAGGTVVHINAGAAGLAMAIVLGRRRGWGKDPMRGHNIPFVMLGAGLLWFGWFGFNAGSALVTNDGDTQLAAVAFLNTLLAAGAALLGWIGFEKLRYGASTTLGAASGIVAGLVAITPAAGFVTPLAAIAIGVVAGVVCATCLGLKERLGFDDSLDVVAVHLVGGLWGSLAVGLFATSSVNSLVTDPGLFVGGGATLLGIQAIAAFAALGFSFVGTFIIGKLVGFIMQNRVDVDTEITGLDQAMHSETAYEFTSSGSGAHKGGALAQATAALPADAPAPETVTTATKEEAR